MSKSPELHQRPKLSFMEMRRRGVLGKRRRLSPIERFSAMVSELDKEDVTQEETGISPPTGRHEETGN